MGTRPFVFGCLSFVAGMLFAAAALADPPGRVGRLSYLSGPVSFAPAGLDDGWSEALLNRPVTTGDKLWSGEGGLAEIGVGATAMRLGSRTSVEVLILDDRATQLLVSEGSLDVRVRSLDEGGPFEIDTPNAAMQVLQPGSYRIDVDPDAEQVTVRVRFGEVRLSGPNADLRLRGGEQATLMDASADYILARAAPRDAFDRFCEERDRRQDEVRSTEYVSDGMTGYADLDGYGSWTTVSTYGAVWFPARVADDWVPYRDGRWLWVEPWGWTWVDNAPWGFAPFHYGRWAHIHGRWGWCPDGMRERPVFAPALVAFVGGAGFRPRGMEGQGAAVGWFPLGYGEAYQPWYAASTGYLRRVNHGSGGLGERHYANRAVPSAITVIPGAAFRQSRPVAPSIFKARDLGEFARAPVIHGGVPMAPVRQSLIVGPAGARPAPMRRGGSFVSVNPVPPRPASFSSRQSEIAREPDKPFLVRPLAPDVHPRPETRLRPAPAEANRPAPVFQGAPAVVPPRQFERPGEVRQAPPFEERAPVRRIAPEPVRPSSPEPARPFAPRPMLEDVHIYRAPAAAVPPQNTIPPHPRGERVEPQPMPQRPSVQPQFQTPFVPRTQPPQVVPQPQRSSPPRMEERAQPAPRPFQSPRQEMGPGQAPRGVGGPREPGRPFDRRD